MGAKTEKKQETWIFAGYLAEHALYRANLILKRHRLGLRLLLYTHSFGSTPHMRLPFGNPALPVATMGHLFPQFTIADFRGSAPGREKDNVLMLVCYCLGCYDNIRTAFGALIGSKI